MLRQIFLGVAVAVLAGCSSVDDGVRNLAVGAADNIAPEAPDGAIRAVPMPAAALDADKTLTRIIFASCAQQNEDQSIWDQLASENPDLILYAGDNVYGDVRFDDPSLPTLKAAYMRLAQSEPFARARAAAPMLTVWDDHDYGVNDGGADYPFKEQSEALFEYAWALPKDDPRRARPGVYGSWMIGEEARQVQIIMLDTRYFRSPLKKTDEPGAKGKERYVPDPDPSKTMLGDAQWAWLEAELKKPADLRLLVSSVQVIADGHGWEGWKMLPADRDRLYALIDETDADNLIILSGDRHSASLYRKQGVSDHSLFEATSSSLNLPASKWRAESGETWVEPGPNRISEMYYDVNYGVIDIDWEKRAVDVAIRNGAGETVMSETLRLANEH
ncbi:Phosphodiesterase/alkaline phosphatase D-like protein [hydrothermal vent metagenome]|uniref:Phosphodiesterase/alkaline phosphatase D-like protein n=1 Tax=hydrothermal vent metagenome TaxID=652676 RepID=A0A3B0SAK4_9ZZZZ